MDWITIAAGILLAAISVPLLLGKGEMLIAGYNTASEEKKSRYNKEKLCRTAGVCLIVTAVMMILLGSIVWKYFYIVFLAVVLTSAAAALWYANTKCKK